MYKVFVVIMAGNTMKDMTTNFGKLDKFEGDNFRRWQKKMQILLTRLKVVYVLTAPMLELLEDATVEPIRIRAKWENDDYICRGHILNGKSDSVFDVYTNVESAKELWDSLKSMYMAEDSSSKKFFVSNFNNYKMVDSRPVIEQYNELLRILGQYTQYGLKMDESISVSSIIDKLPPSWKDFKHTLKHGKDDLSLVELGSHLRIEESLMAQDSDKGKGKEVGGPSVNMTEEGGKNKHQKQKKGKKRSNEDNNGSGSNKKAKLECWKCGKTGYFKRDCRSSKKNNVNAGGSGKGFKDQSQDQGQNLVDAIAWWIDSGATTHVCKHHCWFKIFELVEDRSVLYMGDEHFSLVHGKGSVELEFSSGKTVTLFNVLYVPKLHKNLVSSPVLNKCGYKQVYESNKYILSKCGVFVEFGYYNNGNVHYKRMLEMSKDELIPAIENSDKCTTCMLTKITRQPFKSITRKSVKLELIHSDLCNFHATPSLESRDAIFDENHFYSIPRPKDIIPNSDESQMDDHSDDVPNEISEPRKESTQRLSEIHRMMSSPDHSTSNNEDAFSSNISNYVSTIPDYSLASSGKPYSNALNNSIVILPQSLVLSQSPIFDSQDFFPFEEISPKDTETSVSPSSSVGSSLPIRSTISPLDYPFDSSIFTKLDNSLWITPRPLGEELVPEELNESDTC
nr:zinc finger, CCHC-type [Tanacetum cinerariifolium]